MEGICEDDERVLEKPINVGRIRKMGYCEWADINELYKTYHDKEWGVPVADVVMNL